jgi:hypothetical protein
MITDNLALAEQHVADGEATVERQRALIEQLSQDGHDTGKAEAWLGELRLSILRVAVAGVVVAALGLLVSW